MSNEGNEEGTAKQNPQKQLWAKTITFSYGLAKVGWVPRISSSHSHSQFDGHVRCGKRADGCAHLDFSQFWVRPLDFSQLRF